MLRLLHQLISVNVSRDAPGVITDYKAREVERWTKTKPLISSAALVSQWCYPRFVSTSIRTPFMWGKHHLRGTSQSPPCLMLLTEVGEGKSWWGKIMMSEADERLDELDCPHPWSSQDVS